MKSGDTLKTIVRPLILTACFLAGAFIHGFLSVDFLGLSYLFSFALGAVLWCFRRPNKARLHPFVGPCPFCGVVPKVKRSILGGYYVECANLECYQTARRMGNRAWVLEQWNHRTNAPRQPRGGSRVGLDAVVGSSVSRPGGK